jgi:raffinose/stachyose/melibiose transport system substrate-binding protein
MTRRLASAVVALLVVTALTGCPPAPPGAAPTANTGPTPPAATGQPTGKVLRLWTIWNTDPRKSALTEIVASFEKANPGARVEVTTLEPDAYKTKIRVALGGDAPPDIYFVWSGEKMHHNFVRGGNCLDLTPYLDAAGGAWRKQLVASSLSQFTYDGKTYGLPYLLQCTFFFYNKGIFSHAGLKVPGTWPEFLDVCKKLKAAGVTPMALGNLEKWPAHHYSCVLSQRLMGSQALLQDVDPAGPGAYTSQGWARGLEMLQELSKAGYFNASPNGLSRNDSRTLFFAGKAAMFYTGTWDFAQLSEGGQAPKDFWDQWDFFNFPSVPGGAGEQSALEGAPDGYVVSAKSAMPDQAVAFLKYLSSPEVAKGFVSRCKELVQVRGAVTQQDASWYLRKYAGIVEKAQVISPWADTMMERSVADEYMNGIQAMFAGEKTPAQVMDAVRIRQAEVRTEMKATAK